MIEIDKLPKIPSFAVYDIETGDPVDVFTIDELKTEAITGDLYISGNGDLLADGVCGSEMFSLPKDRFIVQIGTKLYKW